jgi:hypothetical protein
MKLNRLFTEHPESVGENYFEHMAVAGGFGGKLFIASMACFVHAIFPFLCTKTGSGIITQLHTRMVTARNRHSNTESEDSSAKAAIRG